MSRRPLDFDVPDKESSVNELAVGPLTRRAGEGISRRRSLVPLGTAALMAAVAHAAIGRSGKASKKTKKLKRKKCKKQVGQCAAFFEQICDDNPVCESVITCCGLLANCNAAAAVPCIFLN